MNTNEASILVLVGNTDLDAVFAELGHTVNSPASSNEVRIISEDQLSISNFRSIQRIRMGHDRPSRAYANVVGILGLFHIQIHETFGVLETHWGNPTLGGSDPGSLYFHSTVLDRKSIDLSSLPPYRSCQDLVDVSLYARILHCLERVAGT